VVAISNIFVSDLDRQSHSPFLKMVAFNTNVAISFKIYQREPIY